MGGKPFILHGIFERGDSMKPMVLFRPQDDVPKEVQQRYFRKCHYKGSSTTVTNTSTYTPSDEEKELMKQQSKYIDAVMPNAISLNDYAMNLLKDSLGTVQVDYNTLNNNAQNQISNATDNLSSLTDSNTNATNTANNTLGSISSSIGNLANNTSNQYGNLASNYVNAANTANSTLSSLANGELPTAYQQNMENSISSAVNNTVGKAISNLGNRGILNSSVTSSALNDIEKNASDSVASQYQNNINQVANLAQQQNQNTNTATNSLGNIIDSQYSTLNNALTQQGTLAEQQLSNTQGNNSANQGIYSSLINSATAPITTAAGAQEAAISPAQSLWNTSLGLNSANTGALAAAAGKGTSTSTSNQTTSGSSFFGNLLGGAVSGASTGWASGLACFPEGTKIKMADGTEKNIKHVHEGDEVVAADGSTVKVIKTMEPVYNDVYYVIAENGNTSTTLTQSFMKPDGDYVLVSDITIGTELKNVGKVQSVVYSGERKVYDLQTDGDNNYIADGFIANGGSSEIWG